VLGTSFEKIEDLRYGTNPNQGAAFYRPNNKKQGGVIGAMEILKPCLAAAGIQPHGVVVIGTVKGDLHDIGKNLVGMMLEGAGFKVVDAGINVDPDKMIQLAKENNADVIGCSALLTTTMTNMKTVVNSVKSSGLSGKVKVMIGGAPVTQAYADEIGADGYAADAAGAVLAVRDLVGVA